MQHLALFVPWEDFLPQLDRDPNEAWRELEQGLSERIRFYVKNIQLLTQSAEDARRDAKQWAQHCESNHTSGESGDHMDQEEDVAVGVTGLDMPTAARLAAASLTSSLVNHSLVHSVPQCKQLVASFADFEEEAADHAAEQAPMGRQHVLLPPGWEHPDDPPRHFLLPLAKEVCHTFGHQRRLDGELRKGMGNKPAMSSEAALHQNRVRGALSGQDIAPGGVSSSDLGRRDDEAGMEVDYGPSSSFVALGRDIATQLTLNREQEVMFFLVCERLDRAVRDPDGAPQLLAYLGGAGGTGKSQVIRAIRDVFARKEMGRRLAVCATSGAAAAELDGQTLHSAVRLTIAGRDTDGGLSTVSQNEENPIRAINADERELYLEKLMFVVDEVSMLAGADLLEMDKNLKEFRGCDDDFGGVPVILFAGDFRQFPPVRSASILLAGPSRKRTAPGASEGPSQSEGSGEASTTTTPKGVGKLGSATAQRANLLWRKFTTVVNLTQQIRASGDPIFQALLERVRQGTQTADDRRLLNEVCYRPGEPIPWETDPTVVTPLNRHRWVLNNEATIHFAQRYQTPLRIFLSEHKWEGEPRTARDWVESLSLGDSSETAVPGMFFFAEGMPVVVNQTVWAGLKAVNGAVYTAHQAIIDPKYPGFNIGGNVWLHLGPPAGLLVSSESTREYEITGLPKGMLLLQPRSAKISMTKFRGRSSFLHRNSLSRRGLPCAAAFACTDFKVQGRTLDNVWLDLRGTRETVEVDGSRTASKVSPESLYVQLSRARSLRGIRLLSEARPQDIEGNKVSQEMQDAMDRLAMLSTRTVPRGDAGPALEVDGI